MEFKHISFIEISDNLPGKGIELDLWNSEYEGCKCKSSQFLNLKCSCLSSHDIKSNYDTFKQLNVDFNQKNWNSNMYPITECHSECSCDENSCLNRVVQSGPYFNFEIFNCDNFKKGKGLKTKEFIPVASFVLEYMGEIISLDEAKDLLKIRQNRQEPNYIMFLNEFYSNDQIMASTIIDARNYSNLARYINHSCDPNLFVLPVRIGNIIPHAALFSLRNIQPGEELTYDYNGTVGKIESKSQGKDEENLKNLNLCLCNSENCRGYLPFFE
ncbi:unnamed protein product [Brachionus calyciflorus]|uniref:Histone-lysine N-methyltransferase SETMAR n=1 Tax=Brachionus calyciflorus TaxID=104777 RepID=A0A814J7V3_9BILA|nr:unnamed protein product [Brachionus calyciflorus]